MEKKGEILNQLALISDLLEKVNLEYVSTEISFILEEEQMSEILEYITKKGGYSPIKTKGGVKSFSIDMSGVKITFNKSNA